MLKGFAVGFFCFILFLVLHSIIFHNWKIKFRFRALLGIFFSLLPVYALIYFMVPTDALVVMPADSSMTPGTVIGISKFFNFLLGIWIYLFLFFGYCQFYFIIDRSVSVRVMIELDNSPEKKLTLRQIEEIYNPDYIFRRRLKQMVDSKYIFEKVGYYENLRKGYFMAKFFRFLKNYLNLGYGG